MMYNKYFKSVGLGFMSLLLVMTLGMTSCKPYKHQDIDRQINSHADTIVNEYAKGFQIIYRQNDTKINILDPTTQKIIRSYLISDENLGNINVFPINIERVAAMATSTVGVLRELHLEEMIVGISNFKDLCHPLNQFQVKDLGYMSVVNPEKFVDIHPDIIFYSGFDLSSPILNKLNQANLKTFLIYDWKETHPLGRAEWIKVFGILLNKQKEANAIFNKIKTQYLNVVKKLKQAKIRPTVLAGTYFSGVFNAPAGESYMAKLLEDANADYVYAETNGTGSLSLTLEEVISKNKDIDLWVNAAASTKQELLQQSQKFRIFKATKEGRLYSYFSKKNCFFEKATIAPQIVLEDLGKIFYPKLFENHELVFYSVIGQ